MMPTFSDLYTWKTSSSHSLSTYAVRTSHRNKLAHTISHDRLRQSNRFTTLFTLDDLDVIFLAGPKLS